MDQVSAIKDGPEPRLVEYWWDHVHSTPRDERVAKTEKYMQTDHSILNILGFLFGVNEEMIFTLKEKDSDETALIRT